MKTIKWGMALLKLMVQSLEKKHQIIKAEALIAIETKNWIDEKGKEKSCAGFAKILTAKETKKMLKN